jgi:hypothetical protein
MRTSASEPELRIMTTVFAALKRPSQVRRSEGRSDVGLHGGGDGPKIVL